MSNTNDAVMVLAGNEAEEVALKFNTYICQNKRNFRDVGYVTFYKDGEVKHLFKIVGGPQDNRSISNDENVKRVYNSDPVRFAHYQKDKFRVFKLEYVSEVGPIKNDSVGKNGQPVPFTYGQPRYTTLELIKKAKVTSELITGIKGFEIIDTIVVPKSGEAKVDILFVVDNSGSMSSYQANLASSIDKFITILSNSTNIPDFKIGICTTDSSHTKVFTKADLINDKNLFISNFRNALKVGTSGSATEEGLRMALNAVKSSFSRSDAMLFVNIISDENDDSPQSPTYYVEEMKLVKGTKKVVVNAIFKSTDAKHYKAAILTGGAQADINSDYGVLLTNIGTTVMDLMKTIPLSDIPNDVSRIKVTKNKAVNNDWTYNAKLNSIDFTSPLVENDVVDIVYYIDEKE